MTRDSSARTGELDPQGIENKRVVILASSSFGGHVLAKYLAKLGASLFSVSRRPDAPSDVKWTEHLSANILSGPERIQAKLREWEPEIVFDFLGQGMVAPSWNNPRLWMDTNFSSKLAIWEVLDRLPSLNSYVRASTPEVYGESYIPIREAQPLRPTSPYAITHAAQDLMLMAMNKKTGFPTRLVRSANYYGPGQQPYRLIPRVILSILWGRKFPLEGKGEAQRSFIHSEDFARAFALAGTRGKDGAVYHVGTREVISIVDVVKRLCSLADKEFESIVSRVPARPTEDPRYELDFEETSSQLGWSPGVSLEVGLRDTFEWFRQQSWNISPDSLDYSVVE